jgi:hypothetical protein
MKISAKVFPFLVATSFLQGCGGDPVSANAERWECSPQRCLVTFELTNTSNESKRVSYAVEGHRVRNIGDGAKRNEVVGNFAGETVLSPLEKRKLTQSIETYAKPTQVVVTAWVRDNF